MEGSEHGGKCTELLATFGGTLEIITRRKNLGVKENTKLSKLCTAGYEGRKGADPFCKAVAEGLAASLCIYCKPFTRMQCHREWPQGTRGVQVGGRHQRIQ